MTKYLFGIFLSLFSITSSLNAGDFRLTGTNMGSQNYVKLHWDPSTLTGSYSYTLYQSDDNGTTFQSISANYDKTIKVLNVYPDIAGSNTLKTWMETDGAGMGKILVTAISISAFNANPDGELKKGTSDYQYDVIMFGSWDSNNGKDLTATSATAVRAFLDTGRGVLFGHDTQVSAWQHFASLRDKTNLDIDLSDSRTAMWRGSTKVKAINDGFLLKYPHQILFNNILTTPFSHSNGQFARGIIWMNYPNPLTGNTPETFCIAAPTIHNGGTNDFYLTTWNNTAMIQTGHMSGAATTDEKKIIANTLWYLAQFTTETTADVRSAMDRATPNLPGGWRNSGSQITVTDTDRGTPYKFYVKATNLTNSADIYYSDTITTHVKANLKGYFISEDSNPTGVPTVIRDADGNITTSLSLAAKDNQQKLHASNRNKYTHIQAVDSVGNLSAVRTLGLPSVFTDTVWFFGQNVTSAKTSPGIIFDNYIPTDASGKTLVNSQGTNFSMGVKTCDGYAFYTTYDGTQGIMYNRKHEPMGVFPAPANSTDGYAGAYIGGNKYALFVVAPNGDLNYYIVDMNKDGGYGKLIFQRTVANNITQGIELFPKDGTSNAYWLVYYNKTSNKLHVDALTNEIITAGTNLNFPILGGEIPLGGDAIVRSADNAQLAFLYKAEGFLDVSYMGIFDFNSLTGTVTPKVNALVAGDGPGAVTPFSLAFTPDGRYCISTGTPSQFTIVAVDGSSNTTIEIGGGGAVGGGGSPGLASGGGGLKLGPDGIIYQKTDEYIAQILWDGRNLDINSVFTTDDLGENFSIGLTPPAIDPVGINRVNRAPVGVDDIVTTYLGESTNIYPTVNDTDADADKLFLSDVSFAVPADVAMGTFTVDKDHKKVIFTPSTTYPFAGSEEIVLNYKIRDSVVINSICADAKIKITVKKRVEAHDDKAIVFACGKVEIDVTQNDITVAGTTVSVVLPQSAKKGSASINGDKVVYNHAGTDCETKIGRDTVKYDICNMGFCDTANIVITILQNPNITLQDSCSFKPKMVLDLQYDGTYQWQYCTTNSTTDTDWTNIPYTGIDCTEVKEGWYRVKISYSGSHTITKPRHLVQYIKTQMPNGIWYQMELR